jgi:acetoin utilization deacetylase AcuC-like enzyme
MDIIYNKIFLEHDTGGHPENRKRLEVLGKIKETKIRSGEKYLTLVHSKEYVDKIKEIVKERRFLDMDTVTCKKSYEVACYAVGASILASERNDFALVRPPGHHAGPDYGGGFCLFNNLAVAVQKIVNQGKRVFILDFDSHYGEGTAEIFRKKKGVLYTSIHQYPAYPGKGWIKEMKKSKGRNICVPLPERSGDDLFLFSGEYLLEIAKEFKPDVIAVSAGFDGHYSEELLGLNLSAVSYYKIAKMFSSEFDNIFAVLEGGYDLEFFPKCLYNFISGVNKEDLKFKDKETKSKEDVKREFNKRIDSIKKVFNKK